MRVTIVLGEHDVLEPVDDAKEIVQPGLGTLPIVGRNVAKDVHLLAGQLRAVQLLHQPLQLVARVHRVVERPRVEPGAVVRVQTDDSKAGLYLDRIVAAAKRRWVGKQQNPISLMGKIDLSVQTLKFGSQSQRFDCLRWQPVAPLLGHLIVQPGDRQVALHLGRRKAKRRRAFRRSRRAISDQPGSIWR